MPVNLIKESFPNTCNQYQELGCDRPSVEITIILCTILDNRSDMSNMRVSADYGLLILEVSRSHTTTHHSRQDSSRRVISSSQRPLPNNTQHLQQTDIHVTGRIRTHNLSRRTTADQLLRPRGHWDRQESYVTPWNYFFSDIHLSFLFWFAVADKKYYSAKASYMCHCFLF